MKTKFLLLFLFFILIFVTTCKKTEEYKAPRAYAIHPLEITTSQALLRATFQKGSNKINTFGFEWKKTGDTICQKVTAKASDFSFSFLATHLEEDTEYEVKSFVIDSYDKVWYSNERYFFTKGTLTDIDDNVYQTLRFGDMIWTTENMRVTRYADGTPMEGRTGGIPSDLDPPVYYHDKWHTPHASNPNFGLLYNYEAVRQNYKVLNNPKFGFQGVYQGVCPDGWHVSTGQEWGELYELFRDWEQVFVVLKTSNWPDFASGANNYSQLSVEPAGYYEWRILPNNKETSFEGLFESALFWGGPFILPGSPFGFVQFMNEGRSVRCVKD